MSSNRRSSLTAYLLGLLTMFGVAGVASSAHAANAIAGTATLSGKVTTDQQRNG